MGRIAVILIMAPFVLGLAPSDSAERTRNAEPDLLNSNVYFVDPQVYYAIKLVYTRRLPGTRVTRGVANVTFAQSPYGVSISPEGTYVYDLDIEISGLKPPKSGVYVTWITLPNLSEDVRLGSLGASNTITGRVDWNKFLVVVSLEESDDPDQARWQGPIAFRGLSRSGLMHTMAGHGPFDSEPCAAYGYE